MAQCVCSHDILSSWCTCELAIWDTFNCCSGKIQLIYCDLHLWRLNSTLCCRSMSISRRCHRRIFQGNSVNYWCWFSYWYEDIVFFVVVMLLHGYWRHWYSVGQVRQASIQLMLDCRNFERVFWYSDPDSTIAAAVVVQLPTYGHLYTMVSLSKKWVLFESVICRTVLIGSRSATEASYSRTTTAQSHSVVQLQWRRKSGGQQQWCRARGLVSIHLDWWWANEICPCALSHHGIKELLRFLSQRWGYGCISLGSYVTDCNGWSCDCHWKYCYCAYGEQ